MTTIPGNTIPGLAGTPGTARQSGAARHAPPARLADARDLGEVDVCVVGAGPVGGTLACRLQAAGISVAIVDRAELPPMEHPDFDGRAYAVAAGSRRLLEAAGLWQALPQPTCPITDIRISDGRVGQAASRLFLHFDVRDRANGRDRTEATRAEAMGWMVEARSLRVALNRALRDRPGLRLHAPAEATVEQMADHALVHLPDGTLCARLVVSAEGRSSRLRDAAGIRTTRLPYRQVGMVCAVAHELPHHGTALEHFLPGGPFAQLPMCGTEGAPNISAVVWTERTALGERLMRLDDAAYGREVARRLGGHLGAVRLIGRRWLYPLSAMHAHRYVDRRLALVGDAAHGIHPIAGQGLNLGFRDVLALSALVIGAVAAGGDPGDPALLARYQSARRPDNLLMLAATDGLDRLFSSDSRLLRGVRDLGIAGVQRLPGLKRAFMARAMGM